MVIKIIAADDSKLILELAKLIENVANASISENNVFHVGVSGGSLVKFLTTGLPTITTDFSKWKIFFCDERVVPADDPDSTFGIYKKDLLPIISIREDQFIQIKQGVSAEEAAEDYRKQLVNIFGAETIPKFDMLLLGMGPDGHTCSLFPGHRLLQETEKWVVSITDSPKPPPSRITLTYPVINNAKNCVFAMAGAGKADMVKRILLDKEDLPATRVQPRDGKLYWILDKNAAKYI